MTGAHEMTWCKIQKKPLLTLLCLKSLLVIIKQQEIERREKKPNDLEQVEDALFSIVDTIAKRDAKSKWIVSLMKKNEERKSWHPNTLGYRLDPLESIKSAAADSDDEGIPRVTDLDFNNNVIVSATGHVLATKMPWDLMAMHEREREIRKC